MKSPSSTILVFFSFMAVGSYALIPPPPFWHDCHEYGGHCIPSIFDFLCPGLVHSDACTPHHVCCFKETEVCRPWEGCSGENDTCLQEEDLGTCDGARDSTACGEFCTCCREGACDIMPTCEDNGGHCFLDGSGHECPGYTFDEGCEGPDCHCCIEDSSICIPVTDSCGASVDGGCLSGNWNDCGKEVFEDGCYGDDCACCRDGCKKKNWCSIRNGYCFKTSSGHVCPHTVNSRGCQGADCSCCYEETTV